MQKILLYSVEQNLYRTLENILTNKVSINFYKDNSGSQNLTGIQYIFAGCDYDCALNRCSRKFIFLYQNREIPFAIIRPSFIKERFLEFTCFFISPFLEKLLSVSQERILNLLRNSKYYPGSSKFSVLPYSPLSKIIEVQREIAEKPLKLHSLSSLADMARCSRSWLSSRFYQLAGIRLQIFLIKMRCCYALWQILSTDKQIKSIALEAGYKPLYFSQLFRSVFKVSPSSVRNFSLLSQSLSLNNSVISKKKNDMNSFDNKPIGVHIFLLEGGG